MIRFSAFSKEKQKIGPVPLSASEGIFLKRDYIVKRLLQPTDVQGLQERLGDLGPEDVFIPGASPWIAAEAPALSAYDKGNVWEFASAMAAAHGFGKGDPVDFLPLRLRHGDDYELWRVALSHILSELPTTLGTLVRIGRCSHWLRPHQTRWKADGGFAWPTGYGSGSGGFSRYALPEFDWSVMIAWSGDHWELAHNKSLKPAIRVTLPSRTGWHKQAAIHTLWTIGKEKELRFYGFRHPEGVWRCTAETEWEEDRLVKTRKK
jgi:hypothetical protein